MTGNDGAHTSHLNNNSCKGDIVTQQPVIKILTSALMWLPQHGKSLYRETSIKFQFTVFEGLLHDNKVRSIDILLMLMEKTLPLSKINFYYTFHLRLSFITPFMFWMLIISKIVSILAWIRHLPKALLDKATKKLTTN